MINIPTEELVALSAIMNAPQKSMENSLMADLIGVLRPEDFESPDGRALWSAFVSLWQSGKEINIINLSTPIKGAPDMTKGEIVDLWDHQCTKYTTWSEALTAAKTLRGIAEIRHLQP
jgi:replicative DNA helicase